MSQLSLLIELQTVHDNLRVIQRDLNDFPPDLAALDAELKTLARKIEENAKALANARNTQGTLTTNLAAAQKLEDHSKAAVKETKQKAQFTNPVGYTLSEGIEHLFDALADGFALFGERVDLGLRHGGELLLLG